MLKKVANWRSVAALPVLFGLVGFAPTAAAGPLNLSENGAALAVPIFSGPDVETHVVITNGLAEGVTLEMNLIAGDGLDRWSGSSFSCYVTARETTHFVARWNRATTSVDYECSRRGATPTSDEGELNIPRSDSMPAASGILFVAMAQNGTTVSKNALFGHATVLDVAQGMAYTMPAISFQGGDPLNQDGDKQYRFDGLEYAAFPAALATNFLKPDSRTTGELVLFTLDGTLDRTPVPVSMGALAYDDDEVERDGSIRFDCFEVIDLKRTVAGSIGSRAGHLSMTPRRVEVSTVHEATGNNDGVRNSPAHGWILQTFTEAGRTGAAARTLAQSVSSHAPEPGDITNLNAQ